MAAIKMTDEFFEFCKGFHQDFLISGPRPEDWIREAILFVAPAKRPKLRAFINHLLTGPYADEELQQLFHSTWTEFKIWEPHGVRLFLGIVRDVMDGKA